MTSPDSVEARRASDRARRARKLRGESGYVDPAPLRRRLHHLHDDLGIPFTRIAEVVGYDVETIKRHYHGHRSELSRNRVQSATILLVKAVTEARFTPADRLKFPVVGIQRRLQALQAAGFPIGFVAQLVGDDRQYLHKTMQGKEARGSVTPERARRIIGAYEKLELADPLTLGVLSRHANYCKTRAAKNGYAPPSCWDDDTIDDPQALPEWTGACGTEQGLYIHYRDRILPACRPCLEARGPRLDNPVPRFSGSKLTAIRNLRGLELGEVAEKLGVSKSSVAYWESGRMSPRRGRFDQLCLVLSCNEIDLCEES